MNPKHLLFSLALALTFVPPAVAQQPDPATPITPPKPKPPASPKPNPPTSPKPPTSPISSAITLNANPTIVVYSGNTTLSGRLSGGAVGGVSLRLFQDTTRPYGDAYTPSNVTAKTETNGKYSFAVKPLVNTQYRVVAITSPPATSPPKLVRVRIRVGLKVSDSTPRRGSRVRFFGSAFPAHDGRLVLIQRRSPSGRFVTVARTRLRDAGTVRSAYSRRVRVYRDGVYRVRVTGDGDHINGLSRLKTIDVHA